MQVMQYEGYGDPEKIKPAQRPVPRPGTAQLLVRVAASSVNPVDWKLHDGRYRYLTPIRFPSVPGFDIAGEVVEAGKGVTRFAAGDRVYAMLDKRPGGASAEYALVGEAATARAPANLSTREAAAIPLAGLTALQCLRDLGHVTRGQRVLIVGAAGGVGHFAVQIAKACGATVTAVCSGPHVSFVQSLGADETIDYTEQAGLGDGPYDVVLDLVVRAPLRDFLRRLTRDGVYVASLPSLSRLTAALLLPLVSRRRVRIAGVRARGNDLDALRILCETNKLRPAIDRAFPLSELPAAHAYSRRGHAAGKIVLTIAE